MLSTSIADHTTEKYNKEFCNIRDLQNSVSLFDHWPCTVDRIASATCRLFIHISTQRRGVFVIWVIKGEVFPYSFPSVGPKADPGLQEVSP